MAWLDEMFGVLSDNGTEIELLGGLNFIGFTITPDPTNNRHNISVAGAATTSDAVTNNSSVTGATVTAALNTLLSSVGTNTTAIANLTVAGAGKIPYVSGTPGTYSASTYTTDGTSLIGLTSVRYGATPATQGSTRYTNGATIWYDKGSGAGDRRVWEGAGDDQSFGALAGTGVRYWDAGDGGQHIWRDGNGGARTLATLTHAAGLNMQTRAILGVTSLTMAGALVGVTTLNGTSVAAPVQGTAITTTNACTVAGGNNYDVTAASAYAITLGTGGSPIDGEIISFRTTNSLANAITVTNGGTGGGNIGPSSGTMPASVKGVYDFRWSASGTKWEYAGVKRCS